MGHYWDITRLLSAFRESFQPCPCRTVATPVLRRQIKYTYHIRALHLVIHKSGKNSDSGQNWVETWTAILCVCCLSFGSGPWCLAWSSALRLLGTGTSIRYHIDMDITREAFTPR